MSREVGDAWTWVSKVQELGSDGRTRFYCSKAGMDMIET